MLIDMNNFQDLSVEEQREYILSSVHKIVENLVKNVCPKFDKSLSTQNLLRKLNKETNIKDLSKELLSTLIAAISIMQKSEIEIIKSENREYYRVPLYCYGSNGDLKNITVFDRVSKLELCISLLTELERKRILPDKEAKRRLQLK